MRKWILGLALSLLLASFAIAGECCCDQWHYGLGADALYWKPLQCEFDFAFAERSSDEFQVYTLSPTYDWGFRVQGWAGCNAIYTGASYLWLRSTSARGVFDQARIFGIAPIAGFDRFTGARAKICEQYQNADLRVGRILYHGCESWLGAFVNIRWAKLEERREVTGINGFNFNPFIYSFDPSFWGIGPGIGLEGRIGLWNCFGFFGGVNAMALIGERETPRDLGIQVNVAGTVPTGENRWGSTTTVLPGADLRLGIDYIWMCGCWWIDARIGYEINYYWKAFSGPYTDTGANSISPTDGFQRECINAGYAGLIFGVSVGF